MMMRGVIGAVAADEKGSLPLQPNSNYYLVQKKLRTLPGPHSFARS